MNVLKFVRGEGRVIFMLKRIMDGLSAIFSSLQIRNARLAKLNGVSDRDALASDWYAVGRDLRGAMIAYGQNATT